MRLLVIGATRGIGKETVAQGLQAGHQVRALSRSSEGLSQRPGLDVVVGNATDPAALRPALSEINAVILAVGLGRAARRFFAKVTLFTDVTKALLPILEEIGPRRLLVVTGFGAGESAAAMSSIERIGHRAILGRAYADKDVQEEMIQNTSLDWTLVRPVILTNSAATGRYKVLDDPSKWRNGLISRADVGHYLVRAAEERLHVRQAVVLAR
ncbi:MAG: NAD(P)H-binding protein [Pseudomonadota bacterium]